jgi:hypothetical protein
VKKEDEKSHGSDTCQRNVKGKKTSVGLALGLGNEGESELHGLLDESGPQAPGAYPDTLGVPIHERTNALKVGVKDTFGLVVGMADIMPGLMSFSTKFTYKCHWILLQTLLSLSGLIGRMLP